MPTINFPSSPSLNQTYTLGTRTWKWNGSAWELVPLTAGFTGSKGDIGYTGSQGDTGYVGSKGDLGYTGSQGDIGYTGSKGDQGLQGDPGYTGSQGDIGYTGSKGDIGYTGSEGYTGSKGDLGYTGSQGDVGYVGSQGDIGYTGSKGDLGYTGSQGDIGYTGSKGDTGYTGSAGTDGADGDVYHTTSTTNLNLGTFSLGDTVTLTTADLNLDYSAQQTILIASTATPTNHIHAQVLTYNPGTGVLTATVTDIANAVNSSLSSWEINLNGAVGIQGYTGSKGDTGYTGSKGDLGYTGSKGDIGYTGSQGDVGYTGSQGDIGYTGSKGDIGYTGSEGYTGSKGDLGYTGSQGDTGYVGSKGDQGYTGSHGYTGSQGDIGYTGSRGTTGYVGSEGNLTITTSATPPSGAQYGDIWLDENSGIQYFWYNDGNSDQWVEFANQGIVGFTGSAGSAGATGYTGSAGSQGPIGYTGSAAAGSSGPFAACNTTNIVTTGASIGTGTGGTGSHNFFSGCLAGACLTSGQHNVFLGKYSGQKASGIYNSVFIGSYTGRCTTTGKYNTFINSNAGCCNTTGENNTFIGYNSGRLNTTGNNNNFIGYGAGRKNTTADGNVFIGKFSGCENTTGASNVFLGEASGNTNITGNSNVLIGFDAQGDASNCSNQIVLKAGTNTLKVDSAGSLTLNGSAVGGTNLSSISTDVLPSADATYDIGSPTYKWYGGYFSNSLNLGNISLLNSSNNLVINADTTVGSLLADDILISENTITADATTAIQYQGDKGVVEINNSNLDVSEGDWINLPVVQTVQSVYTYTQFNNIGGGTYVKYDTTGNSFYGLTFYSANDDLITDIYNKLRQGNTRITLTATNGSNSGKTIDVTLVDINRAFLLTGLDYVTIVSGSAGWATEHNTTDFTKDGTIYDLETNSVVLTLATPAQSVVTGGTEGQIRYNKDTSKIQFYDTEWKTVYKYDSVLSLKPTNFSDLPSAANSKGYIAFILKDGANVTQNKLAFSDGSQWFYIANDGAVATS